MSGYLDSYTHIHTCNIFMSYILHIYKHTGANIHIRTYIHKYTDANIYILTLYINIQINI